MKKRPFSSIVKELWRNEIFVFKIFLLLQIFWRFSTFQISPLQI
ncbi:unnamed protein product [Larinioides sclopetarius]|uniref:Ribosomal protein L32 n=1 Tax=Larinioides sclopetarius TaxID=280406 RepID=A0AAV2BQL0_9ARAC